MSKARDELLEAAKNIARKADELFNFSQLNLHDNQQNNLDSDTTVGNKRNDS